MLLSPRGSQSFSLSRLLQGLCLLIFLPAACGVGNESSNLQNKCGRDAVYQVARSFGQDVSLQQIDEAMQFKGEVSIAEVVDVLEQLGYHADAMWLEPTSAQSMNPAKWNPARFAYIAALPPGKSRWWHYVFVHSISTDGLTFVQPQNGELKRVSLDSIPTGSRLGLIRVEHRRASPVAWAATTFGVLSSPLVLTLVLGLFGLAWVAVRQNRGKVKSAGAGSWQPRWFLAGGVGLSALAFVIFQTTDTNPSKSSSTALSFTEQEYRAGSLLAATEHPVIVAVKNNADTEVEVVEAKTSCGCVRVQLAKFVIQPSETKTLTVDIKPPGEGESTQMIQLIADDESVAAEAKITYIGRLPARLTPKKWHLGTLHAGDTEQVFRKTLKVTDYIGEPMVGIQIRPLGENPLIHVDVVGEPIFQKDGELELRLTPTDHWHRGLFTQRMLVTFDGVPEDDMSLELQVSAEMLGTRSGETSVADK